MKHQMLAHYCKVSQAAWICSDFVIMSDEGDSVEDARPQKLNSRRFKESNWDPHYIISLQKMLFCTRDDQLPLKISVTCFVMSGISWTWKKLRFYQNMNIIIKKELGITIQPHNNQRLKNIDTESQLSGSELNGVFVWQSWSVLWWPMIRPSWPFLRL